MCTTICLAKYKNPVHLSTVDIDTVKENLWWKAIHSGCKIQDLRNLSRKVTNLCCENFCLPFNSCVVFLNGGASRQVLLIGTLKTVKSCNSMCWMRTHLESLFACSGMDSRRLRLSSSWMRTRSCQWRVARGDSAGLASATAGSRWRAGVPSGATPAGARPTTCTIHTITLIQGSHYDHTISP